MIRRYDYSCFWRSLKSVEGGGEPAINNLLECHDESLISEVLSLAAVRAAGRAVAKGVSGEIAKEIYDEIISMKDE